MIKSILRFLFGTAELEAFGNTEQLLNKIFKNDVKILKLSKLQNQNISLLVYTKNIKKINQLARETNSDIRVAEKHGLWHITRNYRKRYGFFAGLILCSLVLWINTFFVWNIEIKGCEETTKTEITDILKNAGFYTGKLKSRLDIKQIENNFLLSTDKVTWISINLVGTTAYVEIRETVYAPNLADTDEPCSIYASRDGVIASINTYMGYSVVEKGDTVTAGDLVVTGNYTDKYGEQYKLHSYARVMAYTTRTRTVNIPFESVEHIKTGKFKNKYSLKLIRFSLPLYFSKNIIYNNYDTTVSEKTLKLGKYISFPISLVKTTYSEIDYKTVIKTEQAALDDAYEKLYDFEYDLVGITVNGRNYEKSIDKNGVTVKVILDCYEDIGIPGKLD